MLGDLIFALKMLLATIAILFVMQIQVGSITIEDRAYVMIHASPVTHYLQQVALGARRLWNEGFDKVSGKGRGPHIHESRRQ